MILCASSSIIFFLCRGCTKHGVYMCLQNSSGVTHLLAIQFIYVQEGYTALHFACVEGQDDTVKILMRAKADLNLQSKVSYSS